MAEAVTVKILITRQVLPSSLEFCLHLKRKERAGCSKEAREPVGAMQEILAKRTPDP